MPKVLPSQIMPSGMSVTVCAPEYSCVIAKAMLNMPSVTMKGGSLMRVTSSPLASPNSAVTAMPQATASGQGRPKSAANFVITMLPSAMIMPQLRSMPAVRMISVWPIAMTPTTITCARISDRFWALKKRSVVTAKKAQAIASAMKGPSWPIGGSLCFRVSMAAEPRSREGQARPHGARRPERSGAGGRAEPGPYFLPQHSSVPVFTSLLSTPGIGLAAISVTPVSV